MKRRLLVIALLATSFLILPACHDNQQDDSFVAGTQLSTWADETSYVVESVEPYAISSSDESDRCILIRAKIKATAEKTGGTADTANSLKLFKDGVQVNQYNEEGGDCSATGALLKGSFVPNDPEPDFVTGTELEKGTSISYSIYWNYEGDGSYSLWNLDKRKMDITVKDDGSSITFESNQGQIEKTLN